MIVMPIRRVACSVTASDGTHGARDVRLTTSTMTSSPFPQTLAGSGACVCTYIFAESFSDNHPVSTEDPGHVSNLQSAAHRPIDLISPDPHQRRLFAFTGGFCSGMLPSSKITHPCILVIDGTVGRKKQLHASIVPLQNPHVCTYSHRT